MGTTHSSLSYVKISKWYYSAFKSYSAPKNFFKILLTRGLALNKRQWKGVFKKLCTQKLTELALLQKLCTIYKNFVRSKKSHRTKFLRTPVITPGWSPDKQRDIFVLTSNCMIYIKASIDLRSSVAPNTVLKNWNFVVTLLIGTLTLWHIDGHYSPILADFIDGGCTSFNNQLVQGLRVRMTVTAFL